jgi:hypothetical protein
MLNDHQDTTIVTTARCLFCGQTGTVRVPVAALRSWIDGGVAIQAAFPMLSPGEREQLLNGTHGACFDAAFADETTTTATATSPRRGGLTAHHHQGETER